MKQKAAMWVTLLMSMLLGGAPAVVVDAPDPDPVPGSVDFILNAFVFGEKKSLLTVEDMKHVMHKPSPTTTNPNLVVHHDPPFYYCTVPKTGCTRYSEAFCALLQHEKDPKKWMRLGAAHNCMLRFMGEETKKDENIKIFNEHQGFFITRNPYIRFLSSYLDIGRTRGLLFNWTFEETIDNLLVGNLPRGNIPNHITPQSAQCFHNKVSYDYIFRVEEMELWYDSFTTKFNLTEIFAHGWNDYEMPFYTGLARKAQLFNRVGSVVGKEPWKGEYYDKNRKGAHHSDDHLFDHYTEAIARKVGEYFKEDFRVFGYPLWDGNPYHFRYV